ncbi:uncharacterized protein LAESUDRAFT_773022 [Laetiporus sulphureus 93-53]|uniref:Uncharacterized protein n=1 Tax=Laetiporus sulphureus 93-53 TaxID=1314785 RepID=A0A165EQI4_9APHY|nr:uncharacterized protein LAESUDRAFT_773022 [Laetiporus sulphureus 93-53]KZT07554.1 hypothetical protein LAESUDRAFT_773022 [Laetiporus sulphureus 93-53]
MRTKRVHPSFGPADESACTAASDRTSLLFGSSQFRRRFDPGLRRGRWISLFTAVDNDIALVNSGSSDIALPYSNVSGSTPEMGIGVGSGYYDLARLLGWEPEVCQALGGSKVLDQPNFLVACRMTMSLLCAKLLVFCHFVMWINLNVVKWEKVLNATDEGDRYQKDETQDIILENCCEKPWAAVKSFK